jgi:hypothetical protein
MGKFREPNKNRTGDWTKHYETVFWHRRPPLDVKYQIEKTSGQLLGQAETAEGKLLFKGESNPPPLGSRLQLRLEAVYQERIEYSLHLDAYLSKVWYEEDEFIATADRAFEWWIRDLQTAPQPRTVEQPSAERYAQLVRETLEQEAKDAAQVEDQDPIRTAQTAVLDALRHGKRFLSAHHEGGSVISFDGKIYVKENYGEEEGRTEIPTDEEMIRFLREYFAWQSRRDTYPHKPPELDVWKFIERQLR